MTLFVEQTLNGIQFGVLLFLMASGLTLVFGIMGLINIAHGSFFMLGAFLAAAAFKATASLPLAIAAGLVGAAATGMIVEMLVLRRLYARDHLYQALATFGLILFFNELVTIIWGRAPLYVDLPPIFAGSVPILPGLTYSAYRLGIIGLGGLVALALAFGIARTRLGSLIRAAATDREMLRALGVDARSLATIVFGIGAMLAALAGVVAGPLLSVQVGMGENVLITTFVVVAIGGLGSIRGAFVAALLVGMADTYARAYVPMLLRVMLPPADADALGGALSALGPYVVMIAVLLWRPKGLLPAHG